MTDSRRALGSDALASRRAPETPMANAYRALFAAPGTSGFALAGLLARLPLPMTGIGIITLLSQLRGSYALAGAVAAAFVLSSVDQALARQALTPGPVHFNCMYPEPLYPGEAYLDFSDYLAPLGDWLHSSEPWSPWQQNEQICPRQPDWAALQGKRGVIVAGRIQDPAEAQRVAQLAERLGWPLLADIQSHARHGPTALSPAELALANPALAERLAQAQLIIRCGDRLTGKRLNQWLSTSRAEQWLVVAGPGERDPLRLSHRIDQQPSAFISIHPAATSNASCWLDNTAINRQLARQLPATTATTAVDELSAITALAPLLPSNGLLFCGNSLAIRLLEQLAIAPAGQVLANRGASGIDGLLASACGAASGHDGPLTLVIGDLSLLHDLNSLALLARLEQPALVVLLNNGGGNIFDLLPVPEALCERYFRTPVRWDAAAACATFAIRHQRPASNAQFITACQHAWQVAGATVVEVQVAAGQTARQLQALAGQIAQMALLEP